MATRLSFALRSRIADAAMAACFDKPSLELTGAEEKLVAEVREAVFSPSIRAQIDALPAGWLPLLNRFLVETDQAQHFKCLRTAHPFAAPADFDRYVKSKALSKRLHRRICRHFVARDHMEAERTKLRKELRTALDSFSTLESLLKRWPELAPFTRGISPAAANLPAIPREQLNKALGIAP